MKLNVQRTTIISALLLALGVPQDAAAFLIGKHRSITENAVARLPATFSLTSLEQQKLTAEQEKFVKGATDTDLIEGGLFPGRPYDRRYHFDTLADYPAIEKNFRGVIRLAREHVGKLLPDPWGFGKILHAVQDFYAHSNYIALYREYRTSRNESVGPIPILEEVLLDPVRYPDFDRWLQRLRTGQYPNANTPPAASDHGWVVGPGLNNDNFTRDLYTEAAETAELATLFYLRLYLNHTNAWQQAFKAWGLSER